MCDNYILKSKHNDGTLLYKSARFTGFLGFRVCMQSALKLFANLVEIEAPLLTYIPFYKFSQDNIEIFFSYVRSRGGCNNNPTCQQFSATFKKILIHKSRQCPTGSNCVLLEDIPILNCSSKNPLQGINQSTCTQDYLSEPPVQEDHTYPINCTPQNLNLYTTEVVLQDLW